MQQHQTTQTQCNFDLFGDAPVPTSLPAKVSPLSRLSQRLATQPIPAPVVALVIPEKVLTRNDIVTAYLEVQNQCEALFKQQRVLEKLMLEGRTVSTFPRFEGIDKLGKSLIDQLTFLAAEKFSSGSSRLKIDSQEILEKIGSTKWQSEFDRSYQKNGEDAKSLNVNFDKYWEKLEELYGGDAGIRFGYMQQCEIIKRQLPLDNEAKIVARSGYLSISKQVYTEKEEYGKQKGEYTIGHGYAGNMRELFIALRTFCDWAELPLLRNQLGAQQENICGHYSHFKLRDKTILEGLTIVRFKEKYEFQISTEVAEKFKLFLGEFGC